MFLKGFKEKSIKKCINETLANRKVSINNNVIKSLGVIINIEEIDDLEPFRNLAETLNIRPNKFKIIAYTTVKKDALYAWDVCFNPNDFGWHGKIKNIELETFLDSNFDALISYYTSDVLELKLMTVISKAQFKIGNLQEDERINDLIIKTNLNDFITFKKELIKYLNRLNKI